MDRVFKSTLGKEENQELLEWFLTLTLKREMKIIKYLRNELPINTIREKTRVVDLLVEVGKNELLHIELNNNMSGEYGKTVQKRNFMYATNDYSHILERGDDYSMSCDMLSIDLSYGLGLSKQLYEYYYVENAKGDKYVEEFVILVVNMDMADWLWYNGTIEEQGKIKHLRMLNAAKKELISMSKGDIMMSKLADEIITLNENTQFRRFMSAEKEAKMWEHTERSLARKAGLAEGRKEGLKKGIKEGIKEGKKEGIKEGIKEGKNLERLNIIKTMTKNGISIEEISKMINISVIDIEDLLNKNTIENKD